MATYSINPEYAKAFQSKFPNKASTLIEAYIKNMIQVRLNDETVKLDDLKQQYEIIEKKISDLLAEKITVENKIEIIKKVCAEKEEQKTAEENELEETFLALTTDKNFYHKFKHKYIMSGAKDKGMSELEYYKLEVENE